MCANVLAGLQPERLQRVGEAGRQLGELAITDVAQRAVLAEPFAKCSLTTAYRPYSTRRKAFS